MKLPMVKGILSFVALVLALDVGVAAVLERLYARTFTGERGGLTNYALAQKVELLILGSSRAQLQVVTSELGSALHMSAFNAGLKGHDFYYSVMLYDLYRRRHPAPRVVVLTIDPESMGERHNELATAQLFGPYIGESDLVREVLYSADPYKPVEYLSRGYRYNGKVFSILKNVFITNIPKIDGFVSLSGHVELDDPWLGLPRHGVLDPPENGDRCSEELALEIARRPFAPAKLAYLRQLAARTRAEGTRLFLVHPPILGLSREAHDAWLGRLRAEVPADSGAEVIDVCEFSHPALFAGHPELFRDFAHLNEVGGQLFTHELGRILRSRLAQSVPRQ